MESGEVVIRGLKIHYELARPGHTVRYRAFLLSAPGSSTALWRHILPELTDAGCLCVLCDMPGFGKSELSEELPLEQSMRARYLWGLLDEIDLSITGQLGCWHLMAQGSACGTIAEMAIQQPDSASSLFMASPILYSPIPSILKPLLKTRLAERLVRRWMHKKIAPHKRFAALMTRLYSRPLNEKHIEALHRPLLRWVGHENLLCRFIADGYTVNTASLSSLFIPSMIIWGGRDCLMGGSIPRRLRKRDFPNAEYHLLISAGHYAVETNSRAVRDFLRGWIKELWN